MLLQSSLQDIVTLIKAKSGKEISLNVVNEKTIRIGYTIKTKVLLIGELSKYIVIDLTLDRLIGETLCLTYTASGLGVDLILKGLFTALPTFSNQKLMENIGNNSLIVHLNEIPQIHNVLQFVAIDAVEFRNDLVIVDFNVK